MMYVYASGQNAECTLGSCWFEEKQHVNLILTIGTQRNRSRNFPNTEKSASVEHFVLHPDTELILQVPLTTIPFFFPFLPPSFSSSPLYSLSPELIHSLTPFQDFLYPSPFHTFQLMSSYAAFTPPFTGCTLRCECPLPRHPMSLVQTVQAQKKPIV